MAAWSQAGNIKGPQGPIGPQGIQGIPGPVGPATFNPRGAYNAAQTYAAGDVVTWGGSSYYATATHAANQPPTGTPADPGTDDQATNSGWEFLAVQGAQGPQGIQGIQGVAGAVGPQGAVGAVGAQGVQGPAGPEGAQGPVGATGAAGAQGLQGIQGLTGAEGPTGPTGPQGLQGPAGAAGATGTRGTWFLTGTGTPGNIPGIAVGDKYLDLTTGDVYEYA